MNLLHIDSSIRGEQSVSRILSKAVVERPKGLEPSMEIIYRDLVTSPLPHLIGKHLARVPDVIDDVTLGERALEEFINADVIVIGVPLYNLSVSSQLKAWIDQIVVPGRTFRYTSMVPKAWRMTSASFSLWPAVGIIDRETAWQSTNTPRLIFARYLRSLG